MQNIHSTLRGGEGGSSFNAYLRFSSHDKPGKVPRLLNYERGIIYKAHLSYL